MGVPPPKALINVKIDEIFDLGMPGLGKKIA
jgi:hypothetical protein